MDKKIKNKTICIIPARRGSKRLPLKNILEIKGKPVIAYSIEEAKKTGLFEKVYVATEDREIAEIAKKYGAEVPTLVPAELCGDKNPSWEPCLFLIDFLSEREEKKYRNLLCLQPSSVLKNSSDITAGMEEFKRGNYDFLVSVTPIDPHYFHWAVEKKPNGKWKMHFGSKFLKDRSELPEFFRPNGAIKIANIKKLWKEKSFFGPNLGASFMPEERSLHLANKTDLKLAEILMEI
jgi:CMP-N,N'-diacetyllegionaminic acid synthase